MTRPETTRSTGTLRGVLRRTLDALDHDVETGEALRGPLWDDLLAALADARPADEPRTLVGERFGRLRVDRRLGVGGMGEVYEAYDELLERPVALKILRRDRPLSNEARRRFLREARCLGRLDHPHVCRLFDLVREGDDDALVLELVPGQSLRERLDGSDPSGPPLDEEAALRLIAETADGLAAAHADGVVHRDLKPGNLMLTPTGAKLIDFGIARAPVDRDLTPDATSDTRRPGETAPGETSGSNAEPPAAPTVTRRGATLGTLAYMSPEQARGETPTSAGDVYSLGLILYELLHGAPARAPRPGDDTFEAMLAAARDGRIEPIEGGRPALRELLDAMLHIDPEHRPAALDVARSLRTILAEPERRRRRRRLALAAGIALAAVVAAAAATAVWSRPEPLFANGETPRLAVAPFQNATGVESLDWVERGLADIVSGNLASTEGVDVVPFAAVAALEPADDASASDADRAVSIRRRTGATVVLVARVERAPGGGHRIVYRPVRAGVDSRERRVDAAEILDAANEVSGRLARRLAPDSLVPDVYERLSADPTANLVFAIGLDRQRQQRFVASEPFFRSALGLDPSFVEAKMQLAESLHGQSDWDASDELAREILETARAADRPELEAAAYETLSAAQYFRGDTDEAQTLAEAAIDAAERADDPDLLARTRATLARTVLRGTDWERALELLEESLRVYQSTGNREEEARVRQALGVVTSENGRMTEADVHFTESLRLSRETGAVRVELMTLDSLSILAFNREDYETAEVLLAQTSPLLDEVGNQVSKIYHAVNLSNLHMALERPDDARIAFEVGDAICAEVDAANACALLAWNRAEYVLRHGTLDPSIAALLDRAAAFYGEEDGDILYTRALEAGLDGRLDDARALLRRSLEVTPPARGAAFVDNFTSAVGPPGDAVAGLVPATDPATTDA